MKYGLFSEAFETMAPNRSVLLSLLLFTVAVNGQWPNADYIREQIKTVPESRNSGGNGEPLLLTPLIDAGSFEEARNRSRVFLNGTDVVSFSGYLTVNARYNSNLFFWFFPCLNKSAESPLVVWLEGGPGFATVFAVFTGNGPWRLDSRFELHEAEFPWTSEFNLLYFDNPVGAGFSFVEDYYGYSRDISDVSSNLYNALQQFLVIFDHYVERDLYIMGVSYAGKYVPGLAHEIHTENLRNATVHLNLKGIAIENGLVDPESQLYYGDYLYNLGLIDESQLKVYLRRQNQTLAAIRRGDHAIAFCLLVSMLIGCDSTQESYYRNYTGLESTYNFLISRRPVDLDYWSVFLSLAEVRRSIHVGNHSISDEMFVINSMENDITKSVKPLLEVLLSNGYKTLLYNGQVDVVVPYVLTSTMVKGLNWTHAEETASSPRVTWRVDSGDTQVAGYVKRTHNLVRVLVRNAGHMVAYDQPRVAFDMITKFVFDRPFA